MSELVSNGVQIYQFPTDDEAVAEINSSMNVREVWVYIYIYIYHNIMMFCYWSKQIHTICSYTGIFNVEPVACVAGTSPFCCDWKQWRGSNWEQNGAGQTVPVGRGAGLVLLLIVHKDIYHCLIFRLKCLNWAMLYFLFYLLIDLFFVQKQMNGKGCIWYFTCVYYDFIQVCIIFFINVYFYSARMHSINQKRTVKTVTLLQNIFEINAVILSFQTKNILGQHSCFQHW